MKKIIVLLVIITQTIFADSEITKLQKSIEAEKIALETGRPRDPNETYNQFKSERIKRIRELNKQLKKIEVNKQK